MNFFKTLYKNKFLRVVVLLIILLLPFTLDYRFVVVDGESMYPTYDHGEIIIQERISSLGEYWSPQRQDVVVVIVDTEKIIKRVIAVSGEVVRIDANGNILVNEKKYSDAFSTKTLGNVPKAFRRLEKGEYWVVGDNRSESWYGIINIKNIEGKVLY